MDHMQKSWAWMTGTLKGLIDARSFSMQVTEYDWSKVNNVFYEDNGVVIKSIPAIHLAGKVRQGLSATPVNAPAMVKMRASTPIMAT